MGMPELPEMETYRRMLNERVGGRTVQAATVTREKTINVSPGQFLSRVEGRIIERVDRAAKTLLFRLDSGDSLQLHLMLGGSMFYGRPEEAPDRTAQVSLQFGEHVLFFHGLRLGYLHIYTPEELAERIAKYGPDPTEPGFGPDEFASRLKTKPRGTLKFTLTDQEVLAGIGNCYADEMCFAARLHPLRKISSLQPEDWQALYTAMRSTLAEGIRFGGYMETPFFAGDRHTGGYNERLKVYDRGGEPCPRCGNAIVKTESNGRKVFFCGVCQGQGGEVGDRGGEAQARRLSYQH